ncbi:MAG: hypothetical protein U9Q70_01290 [Chloroflexota bacterium]|nr:hypothetical protein [Chloroflexota bacterium]
MANVRTLLLCEDTAVAEGSRRLSYLNVFRDLAAGTFPTRVARLVAITTWECQPTELIRARITISAPDGTVLAEAQAQFTDVHVHTYRAYFNGLVLPTPGDYPVRVYAGTTLKAELTLQLNSFPVEAE